MDNHINPHMRFKQIDDLTSDVLFEAYGKDLKEVFENSALALFTLMCKIDKVKPKKQNILYIKGKDAEDLFFNWLNELIALVDTEEMFYSKFVIEQIDENKLKAKVFGQPISPEIGNVVVKSTTLYKFKLEKTKKGYTAMFSVDI
ncbi:MAG: archease [Candidatus Woesearchaeota archaeon]